MYDELSAVQRALGPLWDVANSSLAALGRPACNFLSYDETLSALTQTLSELKARPTSAEEVIHYRVVLQSTYMLKKFRFGGDPLKREAEAIAGFLSRNKSHEGRVLSPLGKILQREMRWQLERVLPRVDQWRPRFGEGSVAEHVPWLGRWEKTGNGHFSDAELQGYVVGVAQGQTSVVFGRLSAQPKEMTKDRLVTVEPLHHTWVQHGTRNLIYESIGRGPLRGTAMDHPNRRDGAAVHRRLALLGSLYRKLATFDLKDASDLIGWIDVLETFPAWLHAYLTLGRTDSIKLSNRQIEKVNMYAGMGNATTFVVETLYFWALARAVARVCGIRKPFVSVVGDDIIVDEDLAQKMIELDAFSAVGLVMNTGKSFYGLSSFRESCGMWALNGLDVTPYRFDGYDLGSFCGRVGFADTMHKFYHGCSTQRLAFKCLVEKASHMLKILPFRVPGSGAIADCDGLLECGYDEVKTRWNKESCYSEACVKTLATKMLDVPADRTGYLYGALLGCVTTHTEHGQSPVIRIPLIGRGERTKKRWVAIEGIPWTAYSSLTT